MSIRGVIGLIGLFFVVAILGGSFYQVDEGHRGIILRNGALVGVADPGLHMKMPFVDEVRSMSVQSHALELKNEPAYSADRQQADITLSVNYAPLPSEVASIFKSFGGIEGMEARELQRQLKQELKTVFGRYTADTAIRERAKLHADIAEALGNIGRGYIRVEGMNIENIDFSKVVEKAAEDRAVAEMGVATKRQELEREKVQAEIQVTQAQARADSEYAVAEAAAKAIRVKGEAEAHAIRERGKALRENPELVGLITAEKWNGALPQQMVPGSAVPFVSLNK